MRRKKKTQKNEIIANNVYVNVYEVLCHAVETGVDIGWSRAHKHTDAPQAVDVIESITNAVLEEIHNYFVFPQPPNADD
jgi:hypothetical protein